MAAPRNTFTISLFATLILISVLPLLTYSFSTDQPISRQILVLLDDLSLKSSHSLFFTSLQSRGFDLDFKLAQDPSIAVKRYGQYMYDGLILFSPSAERFGGTLDMEGVLDFIDSGHDLILATDSSASDLIRNIAAECGVNFDEDSSAMVIDHSGYTISETEGDHTLIATDDFIQSDVILGSKEIEAPVLFKGIGHSLNSENSLVLKILSASSSAYSANPTSKLSSPPSLSGAAISLVSVVQVMLDTLGPELLIVNKSEHAISLEADSSVILTPDQNKEASSSFLPINFSGLSKAVKKGDDIFIGQYLFTGNETTSVWLEVSEVKVDDVVCVVKNSATLDGALYTLHVSGIHIDLPTLTDKDKEVIHTWGVRNKIDYLSLSYARRAEDVRHAREFLSTLGGLNQTQIFAKIENVEGLINFDEILREADGIILARGNLGIDLPPEKVFLYQKEAVYKCNLAGKPAVITRVVDSMTDNLRPTRAEATDVANAVLDGTDAILLGAETLRGLYPVETISIVGKICAEAEKVYNQDLYFKKTVKFVGEPMTHLESIASSAVRAAIKVKASVIICFTSSGRAARLIAKYRPTMPVLSVVIPRLKTNQLRWTFTGAFEARQSLIVRGLFPMLADPRHLAEAKNGSNESILKVALDYGKTCGVIKPRDRVVVCQKLGDASVVKIIELQD